MLITHLAPQLEAIVRMLSGHHQVLKLPVPFLHQLFGRNDGDNFETWNMDGLRRTTRIPWRTDDVTAGDKLASDSPNQALPLPSRSVARTSCLSKRLAGMNRSVGDEAR